MILHTWNKSRIRHCAFEHCLKVLSPGDGLVLLEDGVYALLDPGFEPMLQESRVHLYALAGDLAVRGISDKIAPSVHLIDYRDFVALCVEHDRVVNWI